MFKNLFKFLDLNQREVDKLGKTVALVNSAEIKYKKIKESDFAKETQKLKKHIADGIEHKVKTETAISY